MASVQPEASGKERILDAAIDLFGAKGVEATTVRGIAAAAGVSPALVLHHFGSKDGLSRAADDRIMQMIAAIRPAMEHSARAVSRGEPERFAYLPFLTLVENPQLAAYIRRILIDGGERASAFLRGAFGQATRLQHDLIAQGVARPTEDVETRVGVLLSMAMSLFILREPLSDVLDFDPLTEDGLERWLAQVQQIVTRGFIVEQ